MSIHFIGPASVEFTGHVAGWRRRTKHRDDLGGLSGRQLADPRADNLPNALKWFRRP